VLAADIYQCGRDKAPNVTEAIQASLISDAMAAAPVGFELISTKMFFSFFVISEGTYFSAERTS
jgi:hypothetical protein